MTNNAVFAFAILAIAALINAASAANHSFTAFQVMQGVKEQTRFSPGDKFSVHIAENGGQALVTYKTVRELPESGDYAIVIHVERW